MKGPTHTYTCIRSPPRSPSIQAATSILSLKCALLLSSHSFCHTLETLTTRIRLTHSLLLAYIPVFPLLNLSHTLTPAPTPPRPPPLLLKSLKGLLISNCIRSKLLCLFSRPFSIYPNLLIRLINVSLVYICFPFTAHKHVLLISAHGSGSSQCSQSKQ